ncbi:HAD family hydrolase [Clostridium senegalense]|uniref:HAD family hydrolase n=1 Tax=Clostridium senegalense TaxID=1465809 RepID=UPI0002896AFB|nr:HAD family hydrolase [Clostridium senegalense]
MEKLYLITDLDRTIIHSRNKGFKCVEYSGDREITYMTEVSYNKLQELLKLENFIFVPCTMRSIEQILRVNFIKEYSPKIIICINGAQIYINGNLDLEWDKYMRSFIKLYELKNNIQHIESLNIKYEDIMNVEDFYVIVKFANDDKAYDGYKVLYNEFGDDFSVFKMASKVFVMNSEINKIKAVDYIIRKFNINKLVTAGDSEVDREFTKRGQAILPNHSSFSHKGAIVTRQAGIYSTEELLNKIEDYILLM